MKSKILLWVFAIIILSSFASAALTDGLVEYWSQDTGTYNTTHIFGVFGHKNFTQINTPTNGIVGKINEATNFNSEYCSVADSGGDYLNPDYLTISLWAYANNSGQDTGLFGKYGTVNADKHYLMGIWSNSIAFVVRTTAAGAGTSCSHAEANYIGKWVHYAMTYDGAVMRAYVNGTNVCNGTVAGTIHESAKAVTLANYGDNTHPIKAMIDEVGFWNRSLSHSEVLSVWNNNLGLAYPFGGGPASSNFSVTATDEWNGTNINITVWIGATQYGPNITVTTDILSNSTSLYNITIGADNYFNRTYYDYNVSSDLVGELHQAEICFNATQKVNEAWVTPDNFTIDGTTRISCFNLSATTHNVQANKNGWYTQNQTFTITALQDTTLTVQNLSYANLTIYAIDGTTNESLSSYNINLNSISNPTFSETATGATNHSFYLINDTYNVTITLPGYATTTGKANITVSGHTNYTFTLYKTNSVTITIRDEITNNIITDNVTIRWTNNATTWENITNTGHLFISNLTASDYTLLFYSSNYSTRTYSITVGNLSTQFLTAYMISSTYSTIFTIKDQDTGDPLPDTSFTMYKLVNSTWTTVESKYSDITGKVQVYYDPIGHYRFYLNKADYEDLVFYLNPVLFSTYDVFMTRANPLNYTVDYDDISIIYSPQTFKNNENTTFNFLISSPDGLLTEYGLTLTYPGGSQSASGVNAIGEQLSVWANITNATRWDRVRLDYNYTTSIAGTRTFTQYLDIYTNYTGSENTWMANKDRTFGLGLFERFLIVTIIIIFTVGIASLVGQTVPGMAIGLFLFGFMVYIGFIPIWGIIPSMIVGVIFLVWKSGGY